MTKPVRYQRGYLYQDHDAWFVRYREPVRQKDGSIKFRRRAKRLGSVESFPSADDVEPLRVEFMQKINHDRCDPDSSMTLAEFVDRCYPSALFKSYPPSFARTDPPPRKLS
jgi:hypothetical protein